MSNQTSSDLFNNFEIPAFDAGTTVPAQTLPKEVTPTANENDLMPIYIGAGIAVFVILLLFLLLLKKKKNTAYVHEIEEEQIEEIKRPQAVEIRTKKETNNFATPINLNQCIRLFLENTRTK